MLQNIITIALSFLINYWMVHSKCTKMRYLRDLHRSGPQAMHRGYISRVGGIGIVVSIASASLLSAPFDSDKVFVLTLLFCSLPAFTIGLIEDLTNKIGVKFRLVFTAIGASIFVLLFQAKVDSVDIYYLDFLFNNPIFPAIFTIFAITGLTNAYNIIDGFNGLASMTAILALSTISFLAYLAGDQLITHTSLVIVFAILGFFVLNFPKGLIFLGDGGAYFVGFTVATMSILLISRNHHLSPWLAIAINIYPITETLFSIYRRTYHQGKNPGLPDAIHFHTLVYRRLIKKEGRFSQVSSNSMTAALLWLFSILGVFVALIFKQSTFALIISNLIIFLIYLNIYKRIVRFKIKKFI